MSLGLFIDLQSRVVEEAAGERSGKYNTNMGRRRHGVPISLSERLRTGVRVCVQEFVVNMIPTGKSTVQDRTGMKKFSIKPKNQT